MAKPKPLTSPFAADQVFDPVARFHWNATRGESPFETDAPVAAVVIDFTVPDRVGAIIHASVSLDDQQRAFNAAAEELDFAGATKTYGASPTYMIVAADDPDAGSHVPITRPGKTRGYIPLVASTRTKFNIANMSGLASKFRVQCSI